MNTSKPRRPIQVVYLAIGVAIALFVGWRVPYGWYALYPFTLFATWVHESGHALAAIALGGHVDGLHIFAGTGGDAVVTHWGNWRDGVVCAGGMVAPALVGGLLVLVAGTPRRATVVLGFFALAIVAATLFWLSSIWGGIVLAALAVVLGAVALRGGPRLRYFVAQFLGVELGLDWIYRLDYFFSATTGDDRNATSDVATLAASTGHLLPYWLWGALLAAFSCAVLYLALRIALRRDARA